MHHAQVIEREAAERAAAEKQYPDFKPGDILELKLVRIRTACVVPFMAQCSASLLSSVSVLTRSIT